MEVLIMIMVTILLILSAVAGSVSEPNVYVWEGIQFESGLELSQPESIGLDAVSLSYPANASQEEVVFEVVIAKAPEEMQTAMEMSESELFEYLKTTFLGLTGKADKTTEKEILGQKRTLEQHEHVIPVQSTIHVFFLKLQNGDGVMTAFRVLPRMQTEQAQTEIRTITSTFREVIPD
jgi:hypothetical protein